VGLAPPARAQAPHSRWQEAIDATWGPGLPTARKLEIFDGFWKAVDEKYAVFHDLDVDWAALRDRYRPEVAAGVSRGRFAAIMSQLSLALGDGGHTFAFDNTIAGTQRRLGVPVFVWRAQNINNSFGACVTAQDDGSSLIYAVAPNHPLGLQPGDRVLGYDGRPWLDWVPELLAAQLPFSGGWGGAPASTEHKLIQSSAVNWHLFDRPGETIDILKHSTGTVVHFPTAALNTTPLLRSPLCSEGLPVPGVPAPASLADTVTWGVAAGTHIGYIYVTSWLGDVGDRFTRAVEQLTQTPGPDGRVPAADGLILDLRRNGGGSVFLSDAGLGMLFDRLTPTIGVAVRADPSDHLRLRPDTRNVFDPAGFPFSVCGVDWKAITPALYVIDNCDRTFDPRSYDKPIAVLTGPASQSADEWITLRMTYHPRARLFGKPTNGNFDAYCDAGLDPGWTTTYSCEETYRIDAPHDYLSHHDLPIDQPVWLTPDDVAQGKDTVVDAALHWINSQTPTQVTP
jgi:hypothetical protein